MVHEMEQFIEDFQLEKIQVPTLVAHGTNDGDVPYTQGQQAAEKIPGAKLFPLEGAHHLMRYHPKSKELFDAQVAFAKEHIQDTNQSKLI